MNAHPSSTPCLLDVQAASDHEIRLRFDDGTVGTVDLSGELRAGGVFTALRDSAAFGAVRVGECGQVEWPTGAELCPHALYLRVTGKTARELFPGLDRQPADA